MGFAISVEGKAVNLGDIGNSHPAFYAHTHVAMLEWKFEPAREYCVPVVVHCELRQAYEAKGKPR